MSRTLGKRGAYILKPPLKKICCNPLFFLGLTIRLALIIYMAPIAISEWFVPFLSTSISSATYDPWSIWLSKGGTLLAFPYGYAMWLVFLPMILLTNIISVPLQYGYELTLLVTDFCLLLTLYQFLPSKHRLLLWGYWLSPIVILSSYVLGLNDLIPALFLTLATLYIRRKQLKPAGALCAVAISAKLSMAVALPFFALYLYNNKALRQHISLFTHAFLICSIFLWVPFFFSMDALRMLLGNPEIKKIYHLTLNLSDNVSIYIVPFVYLVTLYLAWRVRRLNFDIFQMLMGLSFLFIVLMTPCSPGWFVWSMPFLIIYQAMSGRIAIILIGIFSILYMLSILLITPLIFSSGLILDLGKFLHFTGQFENHAASILHTIMVAIGVVLVIRVWREMICRNDFFRLSRKPFVIGIAGDSGAGKDTFAEAITGLFGKHSVAHLSGDDYHLWDRQKPMWQVMTHLNPMANNLDGFCNDLISLTDGKTIHTRHYNHQTGKMSKPFTIRSNDFIIASGLHALYLPLLRDSYSLKIYLDIDEGLRRYFKLRRDVHQRGHSLERVLTVFEKREPDSERFIRPQSTYADLTFALHPIHPRMLESIEDKNPLRLKLIVNTRRGLDTLSLNRVLVGICGLHVDICVSDDGSQLKMTIEGEASSTDIKMAADILFSRILEFLDIAPQWQEGVIGFMQLITLSHISQALTKRFI